MAVVKVFDSVGIKTLSLMGNAMEQGYDDTCEVVDIEDDEAQAENEE